MKRATWIGSVVGFIAGFIVAWVLHNYPNYEVTRHRYCRECAKYEQTYREGVLMGSRSSSAYRGGPIASLLAEAVGEHEHRYTEWATVFPTFDVPEEHPEVAEKIFWIRVMDGNPHSISALEQAMRSDRARTTRLIHRLIDPADKLPLTVIMPLEREGTWEERWANVDGAIAAAERRR